MNKIDQVKLKNWCKICSKFFANDERDSQDPEFRKELLWFHKHSTAHKALEVFTDGELEQCNTKRPNVQKKPTQDSQNTMDFSSNILEKKKIKLGETLVRENEKKILPWETK